MSETAAGARADLAFLKAVAEDRGPLPALLGWHLLAVGVVYGLDFIHIWGIYAGVFPWPEAWRAFTWAPAAIVYVPIVLLLTVKGRRRVWGPGARVFAAAWSGAGSMIFPILAVVGLATARRAIHSTSSGRPSPSSSMAAPGWWPPSSAAGFGISAWP